MKELNMTPATNSTKSISVESFEDYVSAACNCKRDNLFTMLKGYGFRVYNRTKEERHALRLSDNPYAPLIVCHADTVRSVRRTHDWVYVTDDKGAKVSKRVPASPRPDYHYTYDPASHYVNCLGLDDRLGIALMLMMIDQKHAMADCHMLVCDNEETGNSTASVLQARFNRSAKLRKRFQPNWMVELDRRGTDAVMYEFRSDILSGLLRSVGFNIGTGSFSDICHLDELGVAGFNIGIGYHNEHTLDCHADLDDTLKQYARLCAFWCLYQHVPLRYVGIPSYYSRSRSSVGSYSVSHKNTRTTPAPKRDRDYLPAFYRQDESVEAIAEEYELQTDGEDSDPLVKCDSCSEEYKLSTTNVWCGNYLLCEDCSAGVSFDDS